MKKKVDLVKKPMTKIKFLIEKRKDLVFVAFSTILILLVYIYSYEFSPILGLTVDKANSIWNVIISLSTSYLMSFIFYYMLVFEQEYLEYRRRIRLAPRLALYFYRMNTHVGTFISIIKECATEEDFLQYKKTHLLYGKIRDKIIHYEYEYEGYTCDNALKRICKKINQNLNQIEQHISVLNEEAIEIYTKIQNTYIFENIDDDKSFEGAIDGFWNKILNVKKDIENICEKGEYGSLNLE